MFQSCRPSDFLSVKDSSSGYCEVTGKNIYQSARLGLEIPCVYRFYGCQLYVDRLRMLLSWPWFVLTIADHFVTGFICIMINCLGLCKVAVVCNTEGPLQMCANVYNALTFLLGLPLLAMICR